MKCFHNCYEWTESIVITRGKKCSKVQEGCTQEKVNDLKKLKQNSRRMIKTKREKKGRKSDEE